MAVFMNDWENEGIEAVISDFEGIYGWDKDKDQKVNSLLKTKYKGVNIIFASYTYENYSGSAYVLFERDGKLWEVEGGHCSCYGLEDQWDFQETSWESIKLRNYEREIDGFSLKDIENALEQTKLGVPRYKAVSDKECSNIIRDWGVVDTHTVEKWGDYEVVGEFDDLDKALLMAKALNEKGR